MMGDKATINVLRFHPAKGRWYQKYQVPRHRGLTVLGALIYIHENLDETLTIDYNCRAGRCGTCGVMSNGKPVLACETLIGESTEVTISAKNNHETVKDLMSVDAEMWEIRKRILQEAPFTPKSKSPAKIYPHQIEKFHAMDVCIECGLCQSACPNLKSKGWVGPMHGVYLAKLDAHPGDILDRSELMHKSGLPGCNTNAACQDFCPKGIPITRDALIPAKEKWNSGHNPVKRLIKAVLGKKK